MAIYRGTGTTDAASITSGTFVRETKTATEGQTVFTISGFTYQPGNDQLSVYVNGVKQVVGTAFAETSSTSITFTEGLNAGDSVELVAITATVATGATIVYDENVLYQAGAEYLDTYLATLDTTVSTIQSNITTLQAASSTDTIAELKALTSLTDGQTVEVNGYYAEGDGGGGRFRWNAASTDTANDGTIILADSYATGRWERIYSGAVNVKWFGAKGDDDGSGTSGTNNTATFNAAIALVNSTGELLYIPDGTYRVDTTPTTVTSAKGIIGNSNGATVIVTANDITILSFKGFYFEIGNLRLINKTPNATSSGSAAYACLAIRNTVYTTVHDIFTQHDLDDYSGILLEAEYTGASDAYFLVHLGTWYNKFENIQSIYNTFGVTAGWGLTLRTNSNAQSVVNPPGEAAGTYSSSVSHNTFVNLNIEGKINNIRLDSLCNQNSFYTGQMLGGNIQTRVIDSRENIFQGIRYNQWAVNPFQIDGANSGRNLIDYCRFFDVAASPWSIGTIASTDLVRHTGEGINHLQAFSSEIQCGTEAKVVGASGNAALVIEDDTSTAGVRQLGLYYSSNILNFKRRNEANDAVVDTPAFVVMSTSQYYAHGTSTAGYAIYDENSTSTRRVAKFIYNGDYVRLQLHSEINDSLDRTLTYTHLNSFHPGSDNTLSCGLGAARWSVVYAATGTIDTSDINTKQQLADIDAVEKTVALQIKATLKKFKFNDAVESKGDDARIHVGVIAQEVEQIFVDNGLDPRKYALFCEDTYWVDADGNPAFDEGKKVQQVTRLGIRYTELLCFIISAM